MPTATARVVNFSPGPATLPLPVLERARDEMLNYQGSGMSVMEMSHRSKEFEAILAHAEAGVRKHLDVPDTHAVLFLQGGASLQFAMVPMNLALKGQPVDVLHTGAWTKKAIEELARLGAQRLAATGEPVKFRRLPTAREIQLDPNASYVHVCSNNTIEGTQWRAFPDTGRVPLVADMSSDILSRRIDAARFGLIFAGAQKNLGPAGVTIVILRKDLAERADKNLPAILQYRTHLEHASLYNTPPTYAIYIVGLVLDWIEAEGGLGALERRNEEKAKALYEAVDGSGGFYACPVEPQDRSRMNVVFRVKGGDEALEAQLLKEAKTAGLVELKGHRSVGGLRASIYNAQTPEGVKALVDLLKDFARRQG
jgi:phosphoserine aminotransferase